MSHGAPRIKFRAATTHAADPRVLVVYCHPQGHRSRVNRALVGALHGLDGVTVHDLYERYPDGAVDVAAEQELLLRHAAVVLQHPFYWYSTPPLLKEWLDVVFEWGWAYGPGGTRLRGKPLLQAISTGGPSAAYAEQGYNRFTIEQLLAPMEQTAFLCGMPWQAPFVVHGTHRISDEELTAATGRYRARVQALAAESK